MSWAVGMMGEVGGFLSNRIPEPNGIHQSLGAFVTPRSLYYAQLKDRLGANALRVVLPIQKSGEIWDELDAWMGDGLFGDAVVTWLDEDAIPVDTETSIDIGGTVRDLNLLGNAPSYTWSMSMGPGIATFGDPSLLETTVSFDTPGTYMLELSVSDGTATSVANLIVPVEGPGETPVPSDAPSSGPTLSSQPSSEPSNEPSLSTAPSDEPSNGPTLSSQPSTKPSSEPSDVPSLSNAPSDAPSITPTLSSQPSNEPSNDPTMSSAPSDAPSNGPTLSAQPSDAPSSGPTMSLAPSDIPSNGPTLSSQPSADPSSSPSSKPTPSPTPAPTPFPTPAPTPAPTPSPTTFDCGNFTEKPTCQSNGCSWKQNIQTCIPKAQMGMRKRRN